MRINIWLHDRWYYDLDFNSALVLASEYYAEHGDVETIITLVSTSKVVNRFQLRDSTRWRTFEELLEIINYKPLPLEVVDAININS